MNSKNAIGLAIFSVALLGGGFAIGFKTAGSRNTSVAKEQNTPNVTQDSNTGSAQRRSSPDTERATTFADIETRITALSRLGRWRADREWQKLVHSVAPSDMPRLLALVEKAPILSTRRSMRESLLSEWAEIDPAAAMDYAGKIASKGERESAMVAVLQGWGSINPEAAETWLKQMPKGNLRERLTSSLVPLLALKNPAGALELARGLGQRYTRAFAYGAVFGAMAEADPSGAAAKAMQLPAGNDRSQALQSVLQSWTAAVSVIRPGRGSIACRKEQRVTVSSPVWPGASD